MPSCAVDEAPDKTSLAYPRSDSGRRPLLLTGCGGAEGSDYGLVANPAHAGQYPGTYAPADEATGGREFRLSVLSDGSVGGLVRDVATGGAFETKVTGRIQDSKAGCGNGDTSFTLIYTLSGGGAETLSASKTISGSIAVRLVVEITTGDVTTSGRLGSNALPSPPGETRSAKGRKLHRDPASDGRPEKAPRPDRRFGGGPGA